MEKVLKYAALGLLVFGSVEAACAETAFHYACTSGDGRYALTVNTDKHIVKLVEKASPHTITTFRILKVSPNCAKYGLELSNNATFCTATQGVADLNWPGHDALDCDEADTD
jgi:hypothetical protein